MASISLYPPLLDNYTPAFISSSGYCRVYFSLSKFTQSIEEIKTIHIAIVNQESGVSVVKRKDSNGRYRSTGIVVLGKDAIKSVKDQYNLYYVDVLAEDIKNGWTEGWKYKIQLRIGTPEYEFTDKNNRNEGLAAWLNTNANSFSEWSTYTITKAIGNSIITIPVFEYDNEKSGNTGDSKKTYSIYSSTLEFTGAYKNTDASEILYSYRLFLYDESGKLLEDSDLIYASQYNNNQQFYYLFSTNFDDSKAYKLKLVYETLNKYTETLVFDFNTFLSYTYKDDIKIMLAEDGGIMNQYTSVEEEQNTGRIAIKLYSDVEGPYFGNVCIRRSDSKTNFTEWEDIKIVPIVHQGINDLPLIYDYTIESGVWYKYGIQEIDNSGYRHTLIEKEPIKREFEYTFLLGENNQQLRVCYDNSLDGFKRVLSETKTDTIGGRFPFITRNGNMDYKTFSMGGLISFTMDLDNLFATKKDIYEYKEVVNLYNRNKEIKEYDYTYERDFREKVLNFLTDGKPKLYKSPTEGNILIKLMDVGMSPNQTLGRLIFSFSATAVEIAEPTMENYLKYNFYEIGEVEKDFKYTEPRLGQIHATVSFGTDIIALIKNKYNKDNVYGSNYRVNSIRYMKIYFPGDPYPVLNNANVIVNGYKIFYGASGITISNNRDTYVFDDLMVILPEDTLTLGASTDTKIKTVEIEVDFVYDISIEPKKERVVASRTVSKNIGQLAEPLYSYESVYEKTYYKYFYEYGDDFRRLYDLKCLCIEANPGAVFKITDLEDDKDEGTLHVMNHTGILNLEDLGSIPDITYIGIRQDDGTIDENEPMTTIIDYVYYLLEGKYIAKEN